MLFLVRNFHIDRYVARVDENALQGTALIFVDPYISRVYDDDTGKNGVFSLTLLGNNGTFEISPNVAERRANFLIYVRDNHLLDYEVRHSVQFQVILILSIGKITRNQYNQNQCNFRFWLKSWVQQQIYQQS